MTGTWPLGWATGDIETGAQYGKGIGSIFDTTLGSSAASIDITSIVGSYAHLLIVIYARSDTVTVANGVAVRFNGDTSGDYDYQYMQGQAAAVTAVESFTNSLALVGHMPGSSAAANLFNAGLVFIPHYAGSSNNKAFVAISGTKAGTSTTNLRNTLSGGSWRSNAAITQVTLVPVSAGNFIAGTRVTLYGMGA